MNIVLNDKHVDTLIRKGVQEGDYIPNTSLRLAPDGSLVGGSNTGYRPTYSTAQPAVPPTAIPPTAAPPAVGTPTPTSSANTPMSALNVPTDPYQTEYDRYSQMYKTQADQNVDPNKIYRDQLKMYQAEIDAVNQIYSNQLASARQEGLGRLGSTTAASARSGTLGSDFGFTQQNEMQGYNRGIEQGIQAQQAAKIGEIMGLVRRGTADEINAKTQAKQAGAQNYLEYLKGASERRTTRTGALVEQLLASETDPNTVNWDDALKGTNLNKDEIMTLYKQAKQQQESAQAEAQRKADLDERKVRVDEYKAELDEYKADIQKAYNEGRLTNDEKEMELKNAVAWYNANTSRINAETGRTNAAKSGSSSDKTYLSNTRMMELFSAGIPRDHATTLDKLIQENGVEPVLKAQTSMTEEQKKAVREAYKRPEGSGFFLGGIDLASLDGGSLK
jgi:hypothetical protein